MSDTVIALQLYTVRDETAQDFRKTVHRVAEMGYTAVEFAGYGDLPSKEMAALLADEGLRAVSTHVGLAALEHDLEYQINYCLDIGCPFLILPHVSQEWRGYDGFLALASRLNEIGKRCHERGLTFGYHNHNFEFEQQGDKYLLDVLLDHTDPALVKLELDTYWAAFAGVDPIAYMRQRAGRLSLIHVKDMTPERTFAEVGDGILDTAGICNAARESGAQAFIVENDAPVIPSLESARRSLENLHRLGF